MNRKHRTAGRSRRRCAVFGWAGAVGAAAFFAGLGAPAGRADDTDTLSNILGQADANMTKAADALFGISTDSLSANAASSLSGEQSFDSWVQSAIQSEESLQESLSSAAADSSRLIILDKSLLVDTTQVLANDQTAAADPASVFGNGINVGLLLGNLSVASTVLDVGIAGIEAKILDALGLSGIL